VHEENTMNAFRPPLPDPVRVRPLLRAIVRELRERLSVAHRLVARMHSLETGGERTPASLGVRAELAQERQALHAIDRELERLGWTWEEDGTRVRLLRRLAHGLESLSWEPERTGFWPRPEVSRS
jgi:hypothetical protein